LLKQIDVHFLSNGNPTYYELQTKYCDLVFTGEDCLIDLWTEVPDGLFEIELFEPCNTYSFRIMMICGGDTLYSNEVDYFFEGTCSVSIPSDCDYNTWLYDEWFMQQDCDNCPYIVELIEFNGNQYVAAWEITSSQIACDDFLSTVYNCDGTTFCNQGGFIGFNECADANLPHNYSVIETIYSFNDTCIPCPETCTCNLPYDRGVCYGTDVEKWYYDIETKTCQQFSYSGCGGNENNFDSFEMCIQNCELKDNTCNYENWLFDEWFMQQDCNSCPYTLELIEFNGSQYVALWETTGLEGTCNDFLNVLYNCDGSVFCKQGGIAGFNECSNAGLPHNYTVLETIYNHNDACSNCINTCACSLLPDHGPCYTPNDELRWYFDTNTNTCQQFYYGGCGGNENNYNSFEMCIQSCELEDNTCNYIDWLFDEWFMQQDCNTCPYTAELIEFNGSQYVALWETTDLEGGCVDFLNVVYNCDGSVFCNQGGFAGFNECLDAGLPYNYTVLHTIYSHNINCSNCINTCACSLLPDHGPCYTSNDELRWYFDRNTNTCQQFYYGGCGGNENNYISFEACVQSCSQQFYNCPTVLDLEAHQLQSGTYQADEILMYDGISPEGNINLKAGDLIELKPGFSSGNINNNVKIGIEDCY